MAARRRGAPVDLTHEPRRLRTRFTLDTSPWDSLRPPVRFPCLEFSMEDMAAVFLCQGLFGQLQAHFARQIRAWDRGCEVNVGDLIMGYLDAPFHPVFGRFCAPRQRALTLNFGRRIPPVHEALAVMEHVQCDQTCTVSDFSVTPPRVACACAAFEELVAYTLMIVSPEVTELVKSISDFVHKLSPEEAELHAMHCTVFAAREIAEAVCGGSSTLRLRDVSARLRVYLDSPDTADWPKYAAPE